MKLGHIFSNNSSTQKNKVLYLVFFRVSIALFIGIHFVAIYQDLAYLYGEEAMIPNKVADLYLNTYEVSMYRWALLLDMDYQVVFTIATVLFFIGAFCLFLGFLTQPSALLLLILHISLLKTNVFFNYGMDYFASICLFFLCFLPSNVSYSLDAILFKKQLKWLEQKINFEHLRIGLQIFMSISYFFSGFDKLLGYNWRNGESIWKTLTLPYSNLDFNVNVEWLSSHESILIVMGWSVIILEMFYFLIFIKSLRKFWLLGILGMHLGIALILNLYFFSAIMIILNLTACYDFKEGFAFFRLKLSASRFRLGFKNIG